MIDAKDMVKRHEEGNSELLTLHPEEEAVLQHYCSILTDALIAAAAQRGAGVDQAIVNGIRTGLALGLQLSIVNGEVKGR